LAAVYPELRSLVAAPAFTITEESAEVVAGEWGTESTLVELQCTLTRTQTDFAGAGVGRASHQRMSPPLDSAERRIERRVQVPTDAAERFLRDLAAVPVADGPYQPSRITDVRFHLAFAISSDAGPVRIFSDAPPFIDAGRVPWAVEYGGRQMVIDSAAPWKAFQPIRPYLDELRSITQYELDALIRSPAPSLNPSPVPR
jgi:hypothetical protein